MTTKALLNYTVEKVLRKILYMIKKAIMTKNIKVSQEPMVLINLVVIMDLVIKVILKIHITMKKKQEILINKENNNNKSNNKVV